MSAVKTKTLHVNLGDASYDILVGQGLLPQAGSLLRKVLQPARVMVVTDSNVAPLYLDNLQQSLTDAGYKPLHPFILPAGESAKTLDQAGLIVNHALAQKIDRRTVIVALGGGVVGDIAGFAASILLRGIPFVQIPTTLLSQVDSSVGGKTGVNAVHGKNLIGSFYQPKIVLIDIDSLQTLPERERRAGYAEIVKYSFINDIQFFDWLDKNVENIAALGTDALIHAIMTSCAAKARIVEADEKEENGLRALLNLGHTFGHALEAIGGYDGRLLHGEAVAIGMNMAARFSEQSGYASAGTADRVGKHLNAAGLPLYPAFPVKAAEMLQLMRGDKKSQDGKIQLVLIKGIGKAFIETSIDENVLNDFLSAWTAGF